MNGLINSTPTPVRENFSFGEPIKNQTQVKNQVEAQVQVKNQVRPQEQIQEQVRSQIKSQVGIEYPEKVNFYNAEGKLPQEDVPVLSLGRLKGLVHQVWKDLANGDVHAVLKKFNSFLEGLWKPGGLKITSADEFSLNFELDYQGVTRFRGQVVQVDFHLELNIEQVPSETLSADDNSSLEPTETTPVSEIEAPAEEATDNKIDSDELSATQTTQAPEETISPKNSTQTEKQGSQLRLLSPQVVDTGRFQIVRQNSFGLEIFDKTKQFRFRVQSEYSFEVKNQFHRVTIHLLDNTLINWEGPENIQIQKGNQAVKLFAEN
ncbi:hypothetical protein Thein_1711 [Thermodesulfatator indicus DSM 15286]|uniref:Uncharacterized protein n=1 Tax=Thermodesulfatator indicus (strain DSM 15286 / JCM 11887 / CIR29812) TaxID=667014 RepID=F8ABA7_THEID|nr:hypothetical protein [Thermodesulfatator indicus]AEH45569.1 hypothetical protein Thein_1711 [Thermodesulfatator indicus DSM 15286]